MGNAGMLHEREGRLSLRLSRKIRSPQLAVLTAPPINPPRRRLLLFKRRLTGKDGAFCLYGPFKHKGGYTSESNKAFDQSLKSQAPHMGIRDIEALSELAEAVGLQLRDDFAMPANNELLVFVRGICEP